MYCRCVIRNLLCLSYHRGTQVVIVVLGTCFIIKGSYGAPVLNLGSSCTYLNKVFVDIYCSNLLCPFVFMVRRDLRNRDSRRCSLQQVARRPRWALELWAIWREESSGGLRLFIGALRWLLSVNEAELVLREEAGVTAEVDGIAQP